MVATGNAGAPRTGRTGLDSGLETWCDVAGACGICATSGTTGRLDSGGEHDSRTLNTATRTRGRRRLSALARLAAECVRRQRVPSHSRNTCGMKLSVFVLAVAVLLLVAALLFWKPREVARETVVRTVRDTVLIVRTVPRTVIRYRTVPRVEVGMSIPKEKVKSIGQLDFAGRRYRRVDPNQTRLFIAPTAKALEGGQAYLSVYEIFFPVVGVGITNFLLFEGGISLFPFVNSFIMLTLN
jgi:ferredoxin